MEHYDLIGMGLTLIVGNHCVLCIMQTLVVSEYHESSFNAMENYCVFLMQRFISIYIKGDP